MQNSKFCGSKKLKRTDLQGSKRKETTSNIKTVGRKQRDVQHARDWGPPAWAFPITNTVPWDQTLRGCLDSLTQKTTLKLATLDFLQSNITRVDFKFNFQIEMHCREIGIYKLNIGQRQFKILPTAQGNTKKSEKKNQIQNNFNMRHWIFSKFWLSWQKTLLKC